MEPIAKARAQALWKAVALGRVPFGVSPPSKWGLSPESCSGLHGWRWRDWPRGEMPAPDPTQLAPSLLSPLLAGGTVGIEEVGAGLCQVPVEHLQHPQALDTGLQPQAEELLHLQVLDSPLGVPAMALKGCLALLGGHTMHCVLHLGGSLWSLSAATPGQQEACD